MNHLRGASVDGNGGLALGRYRWVHRKIVLWSTFKPRSFTISVTAAITEWVTEIPTHAAENDLSLIMTPLERVKRRQMSKEMTAVFYLSTFSIRLCNTTVTRASSANPSTDCSDPRAGYSNSRATARADSSITQCRRAPRCFNWKTGCHHRKIGLQGRPQWR